jgi:RND family efflux transporter MFP subunit
LPGREIKGRVAYLYPVLDSTARTARARVVVANTDGFLKPGMYATVRLATPSRSALTVPNAALLRTGERNIVFVAMEDGTLMPHVVELGSVAGDNTEVLAGLEPGQRIVTSAQFLLDSESNLAEVTRAMMSQMSSGDVKKMQDMPGMNEPSVNDRGADMKGMPGMKLPARSAPRR